MTDIREMADTTDRELDLVLDAAVAAAPIWEERTPRERACALVAIADALQAGADPWWPRRVQRPGGR
jgi:acyl-CoA reductase-like NAD-dependent aldehyde dehydrogenase